MGVGKRPLHFSQIFRQTASFWGSPECMCSLLLIASYSTGNALAESCMKGLDL